MCQQVLKTSSKGAIRGLHVDFNNGKLVCSCADDGFIHYFSFSKPYTADSHFEKVKSFKGFEKPRNVLWWEDRKELYVGHTGGIIAVYKLLEDIKGPVCKL